MLRLNGENGHEAIHPILLYDGVCGLCNRLTQFILRYDRLAIFRFAALQSAFSANILTRHGANPSDLDTFYVVVNYNDDNEELLTRSDAAIFVLRQLGGIWRLASFILSITPRFFRDWIYNIVAKNRYRIFGRYDTCPIPTAETRARFLDQ